MASRPSRGLRRRPSAGRPSPVTGSTLRQGPPIPLEYGGCRHRSPFTPELPGARPDEWTEVHGASGGDQQHGAGAVSLPSSWFAAGGHLRQSRSAGRSGRGRWKRQDRRVLDAGHIIRRRCYLDRPLPRLRVHRHRHHDPLVRLLQRRAALAPVPAASPDSRMARVTPSKSGHSTTCRGTPTSARQPGPTPRWRGG